MQPDANDGYQAKNLPSNDFFIRFYIPMSSTVKVHVPTHAREMFYQLRRADPSLILGPMDRNVKSQNLFLNHEDALPKDAETCKKYVQGVHFANGKLKLSMRVKNNISYKDLRAILHDYLLETKITMNFDQIESASVFPAGWFQYVHPRYLNRDRMLEFMGDQHGNNEILTKINMYPRQFREKNSDGETVRSDVLFVKLCNFY